MPPIIQSCSPGKSLFQVIDQVWHGSTGNETLHRICTMMRWMSAQSVVIENIDESFHESRRIFDEIGAIEKRLSCKVPYKIHKLTFLQLKINDADTMECRTAKIKAAASSDFLGYAVVVNLTIRERFERSYIIGVFSVSSG